MTTKEKYAFTAGFLDADGYVGLIKRYNKNGDNRLFLVPCIKVANTNFEILDFLKSEYGGHFDKIRFKNKPNNKPAKMWTIRNRKLVKSLLLKVQPYLVVKRKRANIVIDFIDKCGFYRQTALTEKQRREYYLKMKKLNQRGLATTE